MIEFEAFPKIPRLRRQCVITEKLDGTNAAVQIHKITEDTPRDEAYLRSVRYVNIDDEEYDVAAQSRSRLITPENDNYGFARWVYDNAEELVTALGEGRHFGEWWGQGIQRRYDKTNKTFSLFNTGRWTVEGLAASELAKRNELSVVPTLYVGAFTDEAVDNALNDLRENGSKASQGFMNPEGIMVFHMSSRQTFKVTLHNDEQPKGQNNG